MSASRKPTASETMTVAEFLAWNPGDGRLWQLVDGEPVAMAPASQTHGAIQNELGRLLGNHLAELGSRCRVVTTPGVVPRVGANENVRVPDLGVTCTPPSLDHMMPNPVLLVEVLSPSNVAETRANIWSYTTIPSVREILLVHSARVGADGEWPEGPTTLGPDDTLMLGSVEGFSTPLVALYRTTPLAAG